MTKPTLRKEYITYETKSLPSRKGKVDDLPQKWLMPEEAIMKHGSTKFGALLKSLREKRGISQTKLSEKADFDHSYVSRLESGVRMPTREAVDRLADALELEDQRNSLLVAAGFLPDDIASLFSSEPALGEILDLLQDEAVPSEYRDNMRAMLDLLAKQTRIMMQARQGIRLVA